MRKPQSKVAFIRKRVKTIQGRAKFVGFLYLLGAIALAAAAVCLPLLNGTKLGEDNKLLPVLTFYQPILDLFKGGFGSLWSNIKALDGAGVSALIVSLAYGFLLLGVLINFLRCLGKLGWLFKRRASYTYGFNRNMYAMDDMGSRFSGSLALLLNVYLIVYLLSDAPSITMYGYIVLGGGLLLHFFAGLIGGTVTLFTSEDAIQEEPREYGLFTFFMRNLIQLAATAGIVYLLAVNGGVGAGLPKIVVSLLGGDLQAALNIPVLVEIVAWLCVFVLVKHATAATEFNRDCTDGAGMKNFAVFSFFTTLAIAAMIVLPMLGIGGSASSELNIQLIIAAAVAFVAFLLDCIIRPRTAKVNNEDMSVEDYLREGETVSRYNNTII